MKKTLAILLAAVMLFAVLAACGNDTGTTPANPDTPDTPTNNDNSNNNDDTPGAGAGYGTFSNITTQVDVAPLGVEPTRQNTLIVGYNVAAAGDFIPGFSIGAYDQTMWRLLHGDVATVNMWDPNGEFSINDTIVADHSILDDADGNRTYTFAINQGLTWSDGTALTAFDFVTSVLWRTSPQWLEAGGSYDATTGVELLGHEAYHSGESEYFKGTSLISDYEFSITIDANELPYFYELALVAVYPDPAHIWLPGVTITTDENGSKFDADITNQANDVAENFRHAPSVTAGPYTFVSFENNTVTVQKNTAFMGDAYGRMPQINFIQQVETSHETDVDQLFAGEIDLMPDELQADKIERVLANPDFTIHEYLRSGYGVVNFQHQGSGPSTDVNVRWAIAHLMDRQAVLDQVLGGRGSLMDTDSSPGMWMWQARGSEAVSKMRPIALSIDSANEFLDKTEWVFESDGTTAFDPEKTNARGTYLRHNADGEPLVWRNGAANPAVGNAIEIETVSNAAMAGVQFSSEFVDWVTIIEPQSNRPWEIPEEELYQSFSMGLGLFPQFDPYFRLHSSFNGTSANPAFSDPQLDEIMVNLRNTDPDDFNGFLDTWVEYVVRFNEVLPTLILYNNIWMDLHNPRIQGMDVITDYASWAASINNLSLS